MEPADSTPDESLDWEQLRPVLDDAMAELDEADYEALVLRFFKNQNLRTVGLALGVSDDAAQKRVARALEKLRQRLGTRGITTAAGALSIALAANAVQAAPGGLAGSIAKAASTAIVAGTLHAQTLTTMNWINAKAVTLSLAAAITAGGGTYLVTQREVARLKRENQALVAERDQLAVDRDARVSADGGEEMDRLRRDQRELLQLRGEVSALRKQSLELTRIAEENRRLNATLADVAQSKAVELPADPDREVVVAKMNDAKALALGLMMYADAHEGQFPAALHEVTNYVRSFQFSGTNRFELVLPGVLKDANSVDVGKTLMLREAAPTFLRGKWGKAYAFADGHAEFTVEPVEGFEAWERERILLPETRR